MITCHTHSSIYSTLHMRLQEIHHFGRLARLHDIDMALSEKRREEKTGFLTAIEQSWRIRVFGLGTEIQALHVIFWI